MRTLYHFWISPACRKVRLAMAEKGLKFDLRIEKPWERREAFLARNPAGEVPVLIDENDVVLADGQAICEYLEEIYPDEPLLPKDAVERAETRRLVGWFDRRVHVEVQGSVGGGRVTRRLGRSGRP